MTCSHKKVSILIGVFWVIFFSLPLFALAVSGTVGFVPSPIWISNSKPIEDEMVTIRTALWNDNKETLTITVTFYDGKTIIGERSVVVPPGQTGILSLSTKMSAGEHSLRAVIKKAELASGRSVAPAFGTNDIALPKFFVAKTMVTQAISSTDDTSASSPLAAVDTLQNQIAEYIPAPIKSGFSAAIETVDTFRVGAADVITKKREEKKHEANVRRLEEADVIDSADESKKAADALNPNAIIGNALKTPWEYVVLTGLDVAAFIFTNKYIFYPVLAVLVFLLVRFIWRRSRK